MTVIRIPKTPPSAYNHDRPVSSLLRTQILHLREAEKIFPPEHHSGIYINAIKTEAEAAEYIRHVTATIRHLHEAAAPRVARVARIAAAAARKRAPKAKVKTKSKTKPQLKSSRKTKKRK
jgi:hypothetical protein